MTDQPVMQDRFLAVRHFFVVCITFVLLFIKMCIRDRANDEMEEAKQKGESYVPMRYENGDSKKELLATVSYTHLNAL